MLCTSCQFDNPDGMKFCGSCGASLAAACAQCGAENPPGFKFCGQCGNTLTGGAAPPPQKRSEERRHLSVMFCDLVDSTPLSEALDPEEYLELVRRYQAEVGRVVDEWRGHIAQYLGDGVLIYFGYPRAHEDDAYRAVQAGLAIINGIDQLSAAIERQHGTRIKVRIGIHTGVVVAGSVGVGDKTDRLALGSTPNVAARIQSLADPGEVLMSGATFDIVHRVVVAEARGDHQLKGVSDPVSVYQATDRRLEEVAATGAFVGRSLDVQTLSGLLSQAQAGEAQLVLLRGEAGIGKSRLLSEFKRGATESAQWLTLRCSAYHENVDLYPLSEMLKRRVGISDDRPPEQRYGELKSWFAAEGAVSDGLDQLAVIMDVPTPERVDVNRRAGYKVVTDWLVHAASVQPLVLAVEDVHWADPSTLDFLMHAAKALQGSHILVVVTARPSFEPAWPHQRNQHLVELSRVSPEDAREIVRACHDPAPPEGMVDAIVERADGIPLFLEELTRAAMEQARDVDLAHFVPQSLQDALMARIDALGDAKEITQIGALLGRSFSIQMLQAASGRKGAQLEDWVARVVDSGLVQRLGAGKRATLRFRHSLIQDTAYESLLKSQRREVHGQIADTMLRDFPELTESEPQTLARHLDGAGRVAEAVEIYVTAGAKATSRQAFVEAVRAYSRARELLETLPETAERAKQEFDLLGAMSGPLQAQEGYGSDKRRELIDRMSELSREYPHLGSPFSIAFAEWGYHTMVGNREQSLSFGNRSLELAREMKEVAALSAAYFAVGSNHFYSGEFDPGQKHLNECIDLENRAMARGELAEPTGSSFLSRLVLGWCRSLQGYPRQAQDLLEATLAAMEDNNAFATVQCLNWMCYVDLDMRRSLELVLQRSNTVIELSEEHGMRRWASTAYVMRRWAEYSLGQDDQLEKQVESMDLSKQTVDVVSGYSNVRTVDALLHRDRLDLAWRLIERAQDISETNLGVFHMPELHRVRGVVLAREGHADQAIEAFTDGLDLARQWGARTQELRTQVDLATHLPEVAMAHRGRLRELYDSFSEGHGEPLLRQAAELL